MTRWPHHIHHIHLLASGCRGCEKCLAILGLYPFGTPSSYEDTSRSKDMRGRRATLFREELELSAVPNLRSFKRCKVLKPLIVQGFQISKSLNCKREMRDDGRNHSLGNDSNLSSSCPLIDNFIRKGSVLNPQSIL